MEDLSSNLQLYRRMKDLAEQQEDCLSQDRMQLFLQLAEQRERIREEIEANDRMSAPRPKGSLSERGKTEESSPGNELIEVIRSIQEIDRKTEEFVCRQRDSVLMELEGLRKGRKAVQGYGDRAAGMGPARFLDRNG